MSKRKAKPSKFTYDQDEIDAILAESDSSNSSPSDSISRDGRPPLLQMNSTSSPAF
jgi:hypothetical protein